MDWIGAGRLPLLCRRNYYYEFLHMLPWGLVAGVVEGNFAAIVVNKTFGGGPLLLWIASTSHVAMFVTSLAWGALCVGRRKIALMTVGIAGVGLLLATVGAVPRNPVGGWLFVAQMAAAQFFTTGVMTVRTALWKSNYPATARGQVTAKFQMVRAVAGMVAILAAANIFDQWPGSYRAVYPAVALCALLAGLWLRRIRVRAEVSELRRIHAAARARDDHDTPKPVSPWGAISPVGLFRQSVRILRSDRRFARYCTSLMSAGIGNLLIRTVVIIVIAEELLADMGRGAAVYATSAILLDVLPRAVMLGALGRMGRWYDRIGVIQFRVTNGLFWLLSIVTGTAGTLLVVYDDAVGAYALFFAVLLFAVRAVAMGLGYAGGSLAYNLGHLHFAEPDRAELYMGIHVTLSGLRGLTMPGVGVLLWVWIGWPVWLVAILFSVIGVIGYVTLAQEESRGSTT